MEMVGINFNATIQHRVELITDSEEEVESRATLTETFAPLLNWLKVQVGESARDGKNHLSSQDVPRLTVKCSRYL